MVFNRSAILFTLLLASLTLTNCTNSTVKSSKNLIYKSQQKDVKYNYFKNSYTEHSSYKNNFPMNHNAGGLDLTREHRGKPESSYPNWGPKVGPNPSKYSK